MAYRLPKITSEAITSARLARRNSGVPRPMSPAAGAAPVMRSLVLREGAQGEGGDPRFLHQTAAAKVRQVDDGGGLVDVTAELVDQLRGGNEGAAGGDQIIHQQYLGAGGQCIAVDLDTGFAVFGVVTGADAVCRQLARLAEQDQRLVQLVGQHRAEQKAAGIDG